MKVLDMAMKLSRKHTWINKQTVLGMLLMVMTPGLMASKCDQFPRRSICWSGDGQYAVVVSKVKGVAQLYLTTAEGRLSEPLEGGVVESLASVAWFPDSKRFVTLFPFTVKKWEEIEHVLSKDQIERILSFKDDFFRELLVHEGTFKGWEPKSIERLSPAEQLSLGIYLHEHAAELDEKFKLGGRLKEVFKDKEVKIEDLKATFLNMQIVNVQAGQMVPGKKIAVLTEPVNISCVSPDGKWVAYTTPYSTDITLHSTAPKFKPGTLMMVDAEGKLPPQVVAKNASIYPDFTADSEWIVYAETETPHSDDALLTSLGSIKRKRIGSGGLLQREADLLAGVLSPAATRISCQKDGEIWFSALRVTLPTGPSADGSANWFSLAPGRRTTVAPLMPLTHDRRIYCPVGLFYGISDVRPDGKAVIFADVSNDQVGSIPAGRVGYYTFADDSIKDLFEGLENPKVLENIPVWRNNDELSFVVGPGHGWGSPHRPELVNYSISKKEVRVLSKDWPDELMIGLSLRPSSVASSQPGSEPKKE